MQVGNLDAANLWRSKEATVDVESMVRGNGFVCSDKLKKKRKKNHSLLWLFFDRTYNLSNQLIRRQPRPSLILANT